MMMMMETLGQSGMLQDCSDSLKMIVKTGDRWSVE